MNAHIFSWTQTLSDLCGLCVRAASRAEWVNMSWLIICFWTRMISLQSGLRKFGWRPNRIGDSLVSSPRTTSSVICLFLSLQHRNATEALTSSTTIKVYSAAASSRGNMEINHLQMLQASFVVFVVQFWVQTAEAIISHDDHTGLCRLVRWAEGWSTVSWSQWNHQGPGSSELSCILKSFCIMV